MLSGTYQYISSYTSGTLMNGATATTRDAYTFAAGKRFSRVGGNSVAGTLNSGTIITTGGESGPGNLTRGSSTFDGYTLELRGEDGQTIRTYAFFWTKKKNDLMIGGRTYSRD